MSTQIDKALTEMSDRSFNSLLTKLVDGTRSVRVWIVEAAVAAVYHYWSETVDDGEGGKRNRYNVQRINSLLATLDDVGLHHEHRFVLDVALATIPHKLDLDAGLFGKVVKPQRAALLTVWLPQLVAKTALGFYIPQDAKTQAKKTTPAMDDSRVKARGKSLVTAWVKANPDDALPLAAFIDAALSAAKANGCSTDFHLVENRTLNASQAIIQGQADQIADLTKAAVSREKDIAAEKFALAQASRNNVTLRESVDRLQTELIRAQSKRATKPTTTTATKRATKPTTKPTTKQAASNS